MRIAAVMEFEADAVAITVFCLLFLLVTVLGFVAARWKRGDLALLDEWGLGGRRFGTVITWFLLGGDLFTAYTFIAVPALVWAVGGGGFFALPYTIIVFPLVFLFMPRLWSVASKHRYVTGADFVKGRYGSRGLATAIAFTGLLATMPYIALQLVGIQVVLEGLGIGGGDLPLILAFAILAAYTYTSGLRAPAMIALVKDTLIYATVIVAVIYIPSKVGGFDAIFDSAAEEPPNRDTPGALIPGTADARWHTPRSRSARRWRSSSTRTRSRRSSLALAGRGAAQHVAAPGVDVPARVDGAARLHGDSGGDRGGGAEPDVPGLFVDMFPSWFVGVAFAAIAIGALVPAAVMSIAAANLFTRNVWKEFVRPDCSDAEESQVAKIVSLVVKLGALGFVLFMSTDFAIDLQLLGGVWMLQTLPAVLIGLYTRWIHRWGLLAGWLVGMVTGTWIASSQDYTPVWDTPIVGATVYTGVVALALNLAVAGVLTVLLGSRGRADELDETRAADYDELHETHEPAPTVGAGVA